MSMEDMDAAPGLPEIPKEEGEIEVKQENKDDKGPEGKQTAVTLESVSEEAAEVVAVKAEDTANNTTKGAYIYTVEYVGNNTYIITETFDKDKEMDANVPVEIVE